MHLTKKDPYVKVSQGEMRLPGPGYESDNKLHSDQYGRYGALDRMKILGDIAPWSSEYKLWRDIARKTIKDKKGMDEIDAIKKRVEKQSMNHEFYPYKFLHTPTDFNNVTIESVGASSFITTTGQSYKLAGVKFNEGYGLTKFLNPGAEVRIETLESDRENNQGSIEATVFLDKENINQKIVNIKAGEKDTSNAMGAKAMTGDFGQVYGAMMESVAHAPIPFIHNKLLRVDTPLESFKNERIYGTPYSTWNHPIKGFIKPAFEKTFARDGIGQAIALGSWLLAEKVWFDPNRIAYALNAYGLKTNKAQMNKTASVIFNVLNPGAFVGSMMTAVPKGMLGNTSKVKDLMNINVFTAAGESDAIKMGARIGASVGLAGYALTRLNNPFKAIPLMGLAGGAFAEQMKFDGLSGKQGAIVGATAGLILSAIKNPNFNKENIFGKYIPKDTKRRNDIEEYYDRLDYIKYMGLYSKASRKAKLFEGTNIKKIINSQEYIRSKNIKKLERLNKSYSKISNSMLEGKRKEHLLNKIEEEINSINYSDKIFRAGKYTKAAIAYKQAAESTMYGLKEGATSQQVLRAIPNSDKDYYMEFIKEKDKKKRKEILKYLSPYQKRVLQIAWGEKRVENIDSNAEYFKSHYMPGIFWAGWSPRVDMQDVKIKTIENEGMLLSDFGIYESQKNEPQSMRAPGIRHYDRQRNESSLMLRAKIQGVLNGAGLLGVKVSVSPSSSSGIEVIANIANTAKIMEYKLKEAMDNMTGTKTFY